MAAVFRCHLPLRASLISRILHSVPVHTSTTAIISSGGLTSEGTSFFDGLSRFDILAEAGCEDSLVSFLSSVECSGFGSLFFTDFIAFSGDLARVDPVDAAEAAEAAGSIDIVLLLITRSLSRNKRLFI